MHVKRVLFIAIVATTSAKTDTVQMIQSTKQNTNIAAKTENTAKSFSLTQIATGAGVIAAALAMPAAAIGFTIRNAKGKTKRENGPENALSSGTTLSDAEKAKEIPNVLSSSKTSNQPQITKNGGKAYKIDRTRELEAESNVDKHLPARDPKARFGGGYGVASYLDYHNLPQHSYWKEHRALYTFYRWLENNLDFKEHRRNFLSQVKYNSKALPSYGKGDYITESPIDRKLILNFDWDQRYEPDEIPLVRSVLDTKFVSDLEHIIHEVRIMNGYRRSSYQKVGITPSCKDEDFDYAMASELKQGEAHNDGYFEELFELARASPQKLHLVWYGEDFDEIEYLAKQGVTGYTLEFDNWQDPSLFASYHTGQLGSPGVWGPIAAASAMGFKGVLHIRKRDLTLWQRDQVETFLEDLRTVASANKATQNAFTVEYDADIAVSYRSRTNGIGRTHVTSLDDFEAIISDGKEDSLSYPFTSDDSDFTFSELWQEHLNSLGS